MNKLQCRADWQTQRKPREREKKNPTAPSLTHHSIFNVLQISSPWQLNWTKHASVPVENVQTSNFKQWSTFSLPLSAHCLAPSPPLELFKVKSLVCRWCRSSRLRQPWFQTRWDNMHKQTNTKKLFHVLPHQLLFYTLMLNLMQPKMVQRAPKKFVRNIPQAKN